LDWLSLRRKDRLISMPFTPEEREAALKRLSARYGYDPTATPSPLPTEGIPQTQTETKGLVRAMDMEGNIVEVSPEEAKKKGFYILPPIK